jgi:DNA-binding transcriptional LysR family regulator
MELLRSDEIGTLTIGAGLYSTELWLGKTIAKFILENPQQKFEIIQRDWLKVMQMVKENRIDIGLASIFHAAMDPALKTELLKEVRVHFICRAGHPLDNGRDPTMDDLRRYPYVGVVMSKRQADHFGGNAGKFGDIDPQSGMLVPAFETASVEVINQIVIDTDAIGLAPEPLLKNMIAQGKIVALGRMHTPWLIISVGFVYLRDRPLASVIKTFIKTVRAVEEENYAMLEGTQV